MIRLPLLVRLLVLTIITTTALAGAAATSSPSDIRPPRAVKRFGPKYPFDMRKANLSGNVVVEFIVTKEGTVANATAVKTSHPEFVEAALTAVRQWVFEPGTKAGRPVNMRMQQTINFELSDDVSPAPPPGPSEILELSAVTRSPDPIDQPAAAYPDPLRRHRVSGVVVIEFVVTYSGAVRIERLIEASHPRLGEAAIDALMHWKFHPAIVDGQAVNTRLQQRFVFDPASLHATHG